MTLMPNITQRKRWGPHARSDMLPDNIVIIGVS